jgi:putative phage-type endonuclease
MNAEVESEFESESESEDETEKPSLLDNFTEDEIADLTSNLYSDLDDYMNTNILDMRLPSFYEDMKDYVSEQLFKTWVEFNLCEDTDSDFEEVTEFVEQNTSVYLDICGIVPRSVLYESTIEEKSNNDIESIARQIAYLQEVNENQPKQKTKEWHDVRNGLITASNLWKVFGSESQVNSIIYEKCSQYASRSDSLTDGSVFDNANLESALHWGVKYEPLTVMLYEEIYQTKLAEFGCIPHPQYYFIGASPDGINIDPASPKYGRMVEIKNVKNRDITRIPKEEHWVQTQGQMETCNRDKCDFVETRFMEYSTEQDFYDDTEREYKGVILGFMEKTTGATKPKYVYMPLTSDLDKESIDDWIKETRNSNKTEGMVLFSVIYWYLDEFSCVLIQRNKKWFDAALPKIKSVWETIEKERISGYEHRNAKKRQPKTQVTQETEGYAIHNLNLTNSICLIKLDEDGEPC